MALGIGVLNLAYADLRAALAAYVVAFVAAALHPLAFFPAVAVANAILVLNLFRIWRPGEAHAA